MVILRSLVKRTDMKAKGPYSRGCKPFLVSMAIGVEVELPDSLKYCSVKSVATRIFNDFGCRYTFRRQDGKIFVTRLS